MTKTLLWLIGDGLLGSHLRNALEQYLPAAQIWRPAVRHFSWDEPTRLAEEIHNAAGQFAAAINKGNSPWVVLWCAGIGVPGSTAEALEPEWSGWTQLLDLVGRTLAEARPDLPGAVFLASSAGGVYGGNLEPLLTEHTQPQPVSAYGAHKLRMETAAQRWAQAFSNVSVLIGRISSLYGRGQNMNKAQGIISHLSRCLIHRQPVNIYAALDTRRDYLFVDDCARQIVASLNRLLIDRPRAVVKIFASEELTSLARIVGVFFRMQKHRPLIVSRRPATTQPISLKLRSEIWRDLPGIRRTDLAAGIHLVHEHQLSSYRRGLLLPPPSYVVQRPA